MSETERPRRRFTYQATAEFLTDAFKRARAGRSDGVQHFVFSETITSTPSRLRAWETLKTLPTP